MNARQTLIAATLATGLALAAGCATNPVTGKADVVTMSAAQEVEIGRRMHPQILQQYGRYADEQLQAYVSDIGRRIAAVSHRPDLEYTFTDLDSEEWHRDTRVNLDGAFYTLRCAARLNRIFGSSLICDD